MIRYYEIPDSLEDLRGPGTGKLHLPIHVYWQPGSSEIDLSNDIEVETAYQAVISEGARSDIETLLNKDVLIRVWPNLRLDARAARMWHKRFPVLQGNLREEWQW